MIIDWSRVRIFVRPGKTDMRRASRGLSILCESVMGQRPFSGNFFLFCSRDRKLLRALYWDRNGFCLWQKRLEQDKFPWPESVEAAAEIDVAQLRLLLDGINFWQAHRELHYERVQ